MKIFKQSITALPLIVNMMGEYLRNEEKKSNSPLLSFDKVKEKYNKLVKLDLANSVNANELKRIIDNQNTYNKNVIRAQNLIAYIKKVNSVLDKNSYLISFEQFDQICKKYKLVYNLLKNYTGVIPEENIIQLENISNKISKILNINDDIYFVTSVNVSSEGQVFANWVKNKRILYLPSLTSLHFGKEIWSSDIIRDYPDCPESRFPSLDCVEAIKLINTTFLIAAPATHFKDKFKITIRPKDPIVFQICPYGCLIHSVWGEEADDEVLAKYKRTLNL